MNHVLTGKQFADKGLIEKLFAQASEFEKKDAKGEIINLLAGKIVAVIFFEPSTRTRLSFSAAALKLGGQIISAENAAQFSTAVKGETLEDIARIVSGYADAIVMRHPENGAAERAAQTSVVPVINAGDGTHEHPTQALYDVYTMHKELGGLDGKTIVFMGDHKNGRALHSMIPMLALYKVKIIFVSPIELRLPDSYKLMLDAAGVKFEETVDPTPVLPEADVLYVARIMKERFSSTEEYERLKDAYLTNQQTLEQMKKSAIIMAALPRVGEIDPAIDSDPRAAYFREAKNGLYVRMALLLYALDR
ncbi:MAG: aspartate carbamoyltransferase [bacterium]|nr:aspartate carbamoyltransferase [bacterium]